MPLSYLQHSLLPVAMCSHGSFSGNTVSSLTATTAACENQALMYSVPRDMNPRQHQEASNGGSVNAGAHNCHPGLTFFFSLFFSADGSKRNSCKSE